eukprot:4689320-Amphidinium_carterae.1
MFCSLEELAESPQGMPITLPWSGCTTADSTIDIAVGVPHVRSGFFVAVELTVEMLPRLALPRSRRSR